MKKTKRPSLSFLICILFLQMGAAQIFNQSYTTVEQTYSSQNNIVIDADGSSVAVSTIREYNFSNEYNAHVIKTDDFGNVIWTFRYGRPGIDERANAICKTDDGGYIITGVKDEPGQGWGTWVFKISTNGVLQWSQFFGSPNIFISEGFVATRTFENNETYLIAGTVEYPRRIGAIKIDGNGNRIWSRQYYDPALVDSKYDYVTSLVYDPAYDGYIIVGTEHDYYTTGFSTLDLFSLGIDINGNISRQYQKYDLDVGDHEFSPSITRGIEDDGFVISFGTRAGNVQPGTVSLISFMKLDDDLQPQWTNLYASPNAYESNANSVYVDPHGYYDMSVFMYDGVEGGEGSGVRNAAFLRLDPSGNPLYHWRYNLNQDQNCTYMAQDFTGLHENYVIKTDHQANGVFSVGLIRTELYGESECAEEEPINMYQVHTDVTEQVYKPYGFAKNVQVVTKRKKTPPQPIHCSDLSFTFEDPANMAITNPGEIQEMESTLLATSTDLNVYPTIVNEDNIPLNINYNAEKSGKIEIQIFDNLGRLISSTIHAAFKGQNQFTIENISLQQGLNTMVLYQDSNWKASKKVIRY